MTSQKKPLPVDMELKKVNSPYIIFLEHIKAFAELQHKIVDTSHKLKIHDYQIKHYAYESYENKIMLKELNEVKKNDSNTNFYSSVGRAFFLTNFDDVEKDAKKDIEQCTENAQTVEKNLQDCENHIRELVEKKKSAKNVTN